LSTLSNFTNSLFLDIFSPEDLKHLLAYLSRFLFQLLDMKIF
jgi:hypothetical protein